VDLSHPGLAAQRAGASSHDGVIARDGRARPRPVTGHGCPAVPDSALGRDSTARKLRVAYVGHVAQLSGGEIALLRLIDALDEVDAHVILAEAGPLVERLLAAGASVEVLPMRERTRDLRKDRVGRGRLPITALLDTTIYAFRLAGRLRAIQPDLVHTNTLKAGIYGSLAARLARVPAVWHVRDRVATDYLNRPAVLVVRFLIATLPNGVVVNSKATGATLWSRLKRRRAVYSLVYDPVTTPRVQVERTGGAAFVVGMVGRVARWKGQHVFLEAFARAFGGGSAIAVVVGDAMFGEAETKYRNALAEMSRALGIANRVEFRGFREDVWAELAGMDIFVHASITPEPFGQVVVEAMTANVPVIATAEGGPGEILTDGVDGLLYPGGDVAALAAALRRLSDDALLRDRLRKNARIRAEAFAPNAAASSVVSLYRRVLAASGR
jgi:glycosyltransferase involved in cell wall biosynthesis